MAAAATARQCRAREYVRRPASSATVSMSCTAVTRAAMMPTASSTDIIGPPKAKQSSDNCAILPLQPSIALFASTSSTGIADAACIAATAGDVIEMGDRQRGFNRDSVAMPTMPGSSGNSSGLPLAARCTSILRCGSRLKPSTIDQIDRRQSSPAIPAAAARPRRAIHASAPSAWPEDTSTSAAPACRCTQESLPGTSTSNS